VCSRASKFVDPHFFTHTTFASNRHPMVCIRPTSFNFVQERDALDDYLRITLIELRPLEVVWLVLKP
jgi:hypothetical protein